MIEIGHRPILWHIMKIYAHHGVTDFIVCLGYRGYMIKEYFANYVLHNSDVTIDTRENRITHHQSEAEAWTITLVHTGDATMTGGRIKRIKPFLDPGETFCVTYGDGVADIDISASLAFHREHGRQATLAAVVPQARYGALDLDGDRVGSFVEKPPGDNTFINGGFFVLESGVLDRIKGDDVSFEGDPLESLARDGELMAFRHAGFWQPMDTLRDKNALEAMWQGGQAPWKVWR